MARFPVAMSGSLDDAAPAYNAVYRMVRVPIYETELFVSNTIGHLTVDVLPFLQAYYSYVTHGVLANEQGETRVVAKRLQRSMVIPETQELSKQLLLLQAKIRDAPHFARILGCGYTIERLVMVMPYMENGNIAQYLDKNPQADAHKPLIDAACGLQYLHENVGIGHGRIKPENVLISGDGSGFIADFGYDMAVWNTPMEDPPDYPIPRVAMIYAAPQLFTKAAQNTWEITAYDVYAFGILILHVFTGELPYKDLRNYLEISVTVRGGNTPPRPLEDSIAVKRGFSDNDWEVCRSCWTYSQEDRPPMSTIVKMLTHSTPTGDASGAYRNSATQISA